MKQRKVLILFAHPRLDRSVANKRMIEVIRPLSGVSFVDLYATYPRYEIDIRREQERLEAHDIIVFQHPLFWYSTPAIMKEYQDLVLEYGFAYGAEGNALAGKLFQTVTTTGGRKEAYCEDGYQHFQLRELLAPLEQTATLCQMTYLPPFVLYASGHAVEENRLEPHVERYVQLIEALRDDRYDIDAAKSFTTVSEKIGELIQGGN